MSVTVNIIMKFLFSPNALMKKDQTANWVSPSVNRVWNCERSLMDTPRMVLPFGLLYQMSQCQRLLEYRQMPIAKL